MLPVMAPKRRLVQRQFSPRTERIRRATVRHPISLQQGLAVVFLDNDNLPPRAVIVNVHLEL